MWEMKFVEQFVGAWHPSEKMSMKSWTYTAAYLEAIILTKWLPLKLHHLILWAA